MKKSKEGGSVFTKLQDKLNLKKDTPWYRQGKFVGPLLAVVVLSAVVLGVINERTNLFQGSCFTPDCYDFNAEEGAENLRALEFSQLKFGYNYDYYALLSSSNSTQLYPYSNDLDRFESFELSYASDPAFANDITELSRYRSDFDKLFDINESTGVITLNPDVTLWPVHYAAKIRAKLADGRYKETKLVVRFVNGEANLRYENSQLVSGGIGFPPQSYNNSLEEQLDGGMYRLLDNDVVYSIGNLTVDQTTGTINGYLGGDVGLTDNYDSPNDYGFRGRLVLMGCNEGGCLNQESTSSDSYALLDATFYDKNREGTINLVIEDEGVNGQDVVLSGVAKSQASIYKLTYVEGCGDPTDGTFLANVRYHTEPVSVSSSERDRYNKYVGFEKQFNQLYECADGKVNIIRFTAVDRAERVYSEAVRIDTSTDSLVSEPGTEYYVDTGTDTQNPLVDQPSTDYYIDTDSQNPLVDQPDTEYYVDTDSSGTLTPNTGIPDLTVTPEGRDRLAELFAAASVDLAPELNILLLGNTKQLNAEVLSASGTTLERDLTWTTNNPNVATVSNNGVVTAVSVGDATITVSVVGQTSLKDSVQVLVREREEIPEYPGEDPDPDPNPENDTTDPVVTIGSANVTNSVNYVVSGRVEDDSDIQLATVSVNGSNEKALTLDSEGRFAKTVVLTAGVNSLEVKAIDAAGNEGMATKAVLVSTEADPEELAVSISFDAGLESPVDPLRPQLRGTVPFDKIVVNLYDERTDKAIYTVFQHCLTGQTGCSYYSTNQYTTPVRNLDITNWALANLGDGTYYYKAYAKRGEVAVEDYSGQFKFVDSGSGVLPDLPIHPCDYYFTDVPAGIPACGAVALVRELGIFYGNVDQYGQRVFRPNDPLLRTELFAIANRFAQLPQATYNPSVDGNMGFKDLDQFVNNPEAYWFMAEIKRMRQFGSNIIQGYNDGTLRPLVPILVAENAKVILEAGFTGNIIAAQRPAINLEKAPWWQDYEDFLASRGVYFSKPGGDVITRSEVAQFFADLYLRGLLR